MPVAFEVIAPGLLTTVQDAGRWGFEHVGVPKSGAADPVGLAVANLLVGNEPGAAALECMLVGPRLRVRTAMVVGFAGADLGAVVTPGGRPLATNASHRLLAGDILEFTAAGDTTRGCRAYLAIAGGVDVPVVLGSRSTSLVGGFGGFDGRGLRPGDVLSSTDGLSADASLPPRQWPAGSRLPSPADPIRVLPSPAADPGVVEALLATGWWISPDSDRRGLRLTATSATTEMTTAGARGADRPSHGVAPGAIQLTPSGGPLVLMPDAGTTGGYPVIAVVIAADLGILGQLVPGSSARFVAVDAKTAKSAAKDLRRELADAAAHLEVADAWDDLWHDAQG